MKYRATLLALLVAALLLAAPGPGAAQDVQVAQALEEGESQAQAIRGLQFKREVPVRFYTRDELRQYLVSDRDRLYPTEQREQDEAVLKLLGLIDEDVDYQQLMLDLETENISAFYENEEDYIALLSDQEYLGPYELNTILHESVHALQDQYFDIHRPPLYDDREGVNDVTLAGISLVEGDASVCNTIYYTTIPAQDYRAIFDEAASIPTPVYDAAPEYVKTRLYFPYKEGLSFAPLPVRRRRFRGRRPRLRGSPGLQRTGHPPGEVPGGRGADVPGAARHSHVAGQGVGVGADGGGGRIPPARDARDRSGRGRGRAGGRRLGRLGVSLLHGRRGRRPPGSGAGLGRRGGGG